MGNIQFYIENMFLFKKSTNHDNLLILKILIQTIILQLFYPKEYTQSPALRWKRYLKNRFLIEISEREKFVSNKKTTYETRQKVTDARKFFPRIFILVSECKVSL